MRLPSIDRAIEGARVAVRRFPLVVACGLITAGAGIALIEGADDDLYIRLGAATSLGLPLFTAATLVARRRGLDAAATWGVRAIGILLLAGFYWRWGGWSDEVRALRYFHLSAGLHFLVAVVPYARVGERNGFWQFNRELLLRFLTGVVYSIVLFAGLAVALAGIDNLLGVDIDGDTYGDLWMVIAFAFNTWFFAAGVPTDFEALDRDERYPGGLRAFAQYVLLPLVAVYTLILSSYLVRVLVTREWPSGWIGYLVSALAALGILSLLLVHPLRDREGHAWIDRYARTFWIAILPSVAMLLMAIWQRVSQYGITERRYLLSVLALWLAGVAIYYAVSRSRNIKIIPATLAAIALVSFVGPWSAYATSLRSQLGRLTGALERYGVLAAGAVTPTSATIPEEERREMTGALTYIISFHGTEAIDDWFPGGVAAIDTIGDGTRPSASWQAIQRAALLMDYMGIEAVTRPPGETGRFRYYSAGYPRAALDVSGFEWAFTSVTLGGFDRMIGDDRFQIFIEDERRVLRLLRNDEEVIVHSLDELLARARRNVDLASGSNVPADSLRIDAAGEGWALRIYLQQFTEDTENDPSSVTAASGDILLGRVSDEPDPDVP